MPYCKETKCKYILGKKEKVGNTGLGGRHSKGKETTALRS